MFASWPRGVFFSILLFSVLTVAPLGFFEYGGDIMFQYVGIECFGSQFWSGDLYPRWCFDANAGLGSPVFLYYFPLPFYVASLFYPLTWLGLSVPDIYLLCLWSATFAAGLAAWLWLSDILPPRQALFLALVYLWMPYRMEVMMFRSAYGELWCLAFMPLACKYTRRLVQGQLEALPKLALSFGLAFVSNMPGAVIGVLATGTYSLFMARRDTWLMLPRFAAALAWGAALSAFYLVPAMLAKRYITTEGVIDGKRSWSNDFLSMDNITQHGQGNVVITIAIMLLLLAGMAAFCYWRRRRVGAFMQREIVAWILVGLPAVFMLLPISRPVWQHMGFVAMLAFPWRMQLAIMLAVIWLAAIMLGHLLPPSRQKSRTGDIIMVFGMLGLMGLFVISSRAPEFIAHGDKIMASQFVTQREYRTIWTDKRYIALPYILGRYDNSQSLRKTRLLAGSATVAVEQWQDGKVDMQVDVKAAAQLLLDLQYFPSWHPIASPPKPVTAEPQDGTGQMILSLPEGRYRLQLVPDLQFLLGWKLVASSIASLGALAACVCMIRKYKL